MSIQSNADLIRGIPLHQLFLSPDNVRKTDSELDIPQLADLLAAEGVLQNLVGYEEIHGRGKRAKTLIGVVAGGRRYRALSLLLEQNRITPDHIVPCLVTNRERAIAISLAENSNRKPLHPADEFVAFKDLIDQGHSLEDVAARFGVGPLVVQRRLKLANVNPAFLTMYRNGEIDLEHMMAFAVTDDHQRQHDAWLSLPESQRSAFALRRVLTESEIAANTPIAQFVGLEAYQQAGGPLRTDLFSQDDEDGESVFILDTALLHRLAREKLDAAAAELQSTAGAWIEVSLELDYAARAAYRQVRRTAGDPSPAAATQLAELERAQAALQQQLDDTDPDDETLDGLEAKLDELYQEESALRDALSVLDPEQLALAGTLLSISDTGELLVHRNLLKLEDAVRFSPGDKQRVKDSQSSRARTHTAAMTLRLSAHRTLALQATVSQDTKVALTALAHRLILATFFDHSHPSTTAVRIELSEARLDTYADDLQSSKAYAALQAQRQALRARLPEDAAEVFAWLLKQPQADVLELVAFCVAQTLDAVRSQDGACAADAIVAASQLDMTAWWVPTAEGYLGKLPKNTILDIVKTAVSPEQAAPLEKLKKKEVASAAERLLSGKHWVPECFRPVAV